MTEQNIPKYPFLTALRGVAAVYVMLSHIWYEIWPAVLPPYGYGTRPDGIMRLLTSWLYYGHFGVIVFIVLSGFCLALPLAYTDTYTVQLKRFFGRRIRRIVPPYYAALFLSIVLIYTFLNEPTGRQWDISIPLTVSGIVSHVLLLQDLIDSTQINYAFWSVALEFHLYLLFPLIILAIRKWGKITAVAGFFIGIYALIGTLELLEVKDIPPQFIGIVFHFILGATGAFFIKTIQTHQLNTLKGIAFAAIVCIIVACAWLGFDLSEKYFSILDLLCALATLLLILVCIHAGRIQAHPVLISLGDFSYSLYLIHAPIIHWLWVIAVQEMAPADLNTQYWLLLAISVPVCLSLSYVFYLAFEKPFMNTPQKVILVSG